jgi:hypothetical protein
MNKVLINKVRIKARKIAIPPHLGIGFECTLRSSGTSIAPNFTHIRPANGVSASDRTRERINVIRIVVMDFFQ